MKKKVVPKLRQEVKVDIVTSDDIKIYYTGKFQDFTARYLINNYTQHFLLTLQFFFPTYLYLSSKCLLLIFQLYF